MGISIWQLLIVLAIVIVLFGTKKLRNVGGDLGGAIKSFRKAVKDGEGESKEKDEEESTEQLEQKKDEDGNNVIEGEATREKEKH